jgi:hypothetical protein
MPSDSHLGRRADPADQLAADQLGFDPEHTYYTTLVRAWREFPAGSRVLLGATEVAIEDVAAAPATPSVGPGA